MGKMIPIVREASTAAARKNVFHCMAVGVGEAIAVAVPQGVVGLVAAAASPTTDLARPGHVDAAALVVSNVFHFTGTRLKSLTHSNSWEVMEEN